MKFGGLPRRDYSHPSGFLWSTEARVPGVVDVIRFSDDERGPRRIRVSAQALRPSFAFVESLVLSGSEEDEKRWFKRHADGGGGWGMRAGRSAARTERSVRGSQRRVKTTGRTAGKYLQYRSVVFRLGECDGVKDEENEPVSFIVPRDREGLELVDDFDAMGERLTASGTNEPS